ncbi:MAG TPA: hypothetical protein VI685_05710 [Candidatus Angelobacter sp.]
MIHIELDIDVLIAHSTQPEGACVKAGPTNANQTWHVGPLSIVQQVSYNCDHINVNGQ